MSGVSISVPLPVSLVRPGGVGQPMLYAATDIRIRVTISNRVAHNQGPLRNILQKAIDGVRQKYPDIPQEGWTISATESLSHTVSANVAALVGAVGGILFAYRRIWNPLAIQEITYGILKNEHDEASAMVVACVAGGIIWSRRELPFLTSTWQLPMRLLPLIQKFSISFINDSGLIQRRLTSRNKDHEQKVRSIAIALKHGDLQTLRKYCQDEVISSSRDTLLRYESAETDGYQSVMIGGDGIRLESK